MTRRGTEGTLLGAVLMVIAVAIVAAFLVAASATFHIRVSQNVVDQARAHMLAETAVAQGTAAVMQAVQAGTLSTFGQHGETYQSSTPPPQPTMSYLSFGTSTSMPTSLNNTSPTQAAQDCLGHTVPPACVDLIGVGQSGTSTVTLEVLLDTPPFPYVVAASSAFTSPLGGVTIARTTNLSVLASGLAGLSQGDILPGDLASNSGAAPGILLGPSSLVTGNVEDPGTIQLAPTAVVRGAAQPGAAPIPLPIISVTDPTAGLPFTQSITTLSADAMVTGFGRAEQSLTAPGNLDLNGAVIYVHGDLNVTGALSGTGAIFTTGKLTVQGGTNLTSDDMVAVVAGGDVTLTGGPSGTVSNAFNGLVYTQGNLAASNLTLYGTFVANGKTAASSTAPCSSCSGYVALGGSVQMNNCTVVSVPTLSQLTLAGKLTVTVTAAPSSSSCGPPSCSTSTSTASPTASTSPGTCSTSTSSSTASTSTPAACGTGILQVGTSTGATPSAGSTATGMPCGGSVITTGSTGGQATVVGADTGASMACVIEPSCSSSGTSSYNVTGSANGSVTVTNAITGAATTYSSVSAAATALAQAAQPACGTAAGLSAATQAIQTGLQQIVGSSTTSTSTSTPGTTSTSATSTTTSSSSGSTSSSTSGGATSVTITLSGPLQRVLPGAATPAGMTTLFNFDLNQFIAPADTVRVLLWRDDF